MKIIHYTVFAFLDQFSFLIPPPPQSIVMNGVYSAIPFVVSFFVVIVSGPVSDLAISHGVSTTIVRKAGIFTGVPLPGGALL